MSDYLSIQEIGGAELARQYPDRGQIHDCHWYNATLQIESTSNGWRDWLKSLSVGNQGFIAVLSAGNDGLRVLVSLYEFAIFIPWADVTVFAERGWPATVVRLKTTAVPSLSLVFNLDDAAADDLLHEVVEPLPQRTPPRRLAWWAVERKWWVAIVVLVIGVSAGLIVRYALGGG
jgi:hypothetical protein